MDNVERVIGCYVLAERTVSSPMLRLMCGNTLGMAAGATIGGTATQSFWHCCDRAARRLFAPHNRARHQRVWLRQTGKLTAVDSEVTNIRPGDPRDAVLVLEEARPLSLSPSVGIR